MGSLTPNGVRGMSEQPPTEGGVGIAAITISALPTSSGYDQPYIPNDVTVSRMP